ncbi:MAG: hypothetical protein PHY72_01025 [Candidatus Pacebacteria bacterium]|nr:hypothetical protein [Candidatus Paceibacterota bacterium]
MERVKVGIGARWAGLLMVNYRETDDVAGPYSTELVDEKGNLRAVIHWSTKAYGATALTEAENSFRKIINEDGEITPQLVIKILKALGKKGRIGFGLKAKITQAALLTEEAKKAAKEGLSILLQEWSQLTTSFRHLEDAEISGKSSFKGLGSKFTLKPGSDQIYRFQSICKIDELGIEDLGYIIELFPQAVRKFSMSIDAPVARYRKIDELVDKAKASLS